MPLPVLPSLSDIHILFATDKNYVPYMAVSIHSLLENMNKQYVVHIHIIEDNIGNENKNLLENLVQNTNGKLNFIAFPLDIFESLPLSKESEEGIDVSWLTRSTYSRLMAPELLPNIDKIIYLDCDVVVMGNIEELWDEEFTESLAAVETPKWPAQFSERLEKITLSCDFPYFNAGVLGMNLKRLREEKLLENALKIINRYGDALYCHDQDVLNILFKNAWHVLHPKFNSLPQIAYKKYYDKFFHYSLDMPQDANDNPCIIHFASKPKPWHYGCVDPRLKYYQKYASKIPFNALCTQAPNTKQRLCYYKTKTGLFFEEYLPALHKPLRYIFNVIQIKCRLFI